MKTPKHAPPVLETPPPPPRPEDHFLRDMEQMLRTFRTRASTICTHGRVNALCARTVTRLQHSYPGFDPSALTLLTAPAVMDLLETLLRKAPWWHRRVLRLEAVRLLAEMYNTSYDGLRDHGMLERVEQLYFSIKE